MTLKKVKPYPRILALNAIDRAFLIPESDDPRGDYFPMSLVVGIALKEQVEIGDLRAAVGVVEARFPQFRLGYELDYARGQLARVGAEQLADYLSGIVIEGSAGVGTEALVSEAVRRNNEPLSHPVTFTIYGNRLVIRAHHSFGDGRFLMLLVAYVLLALLDRPAFERLAELPMHFGMSLWSVVWQTPASGVSTFVEFVRTFSGTYADYKGTSEMPAYAGSPTPVKTGSAMEVGRYLVSRDVVGVLDSFRHGVAGSRVSLNTLLQVVVGLRLVELGLQPLPVLYTVPVDLRRYLADARMYWPGNLSTQVRLRAGSRASLDVAAECVDLQAQVDDSLERRLAIASMPGEWLLAWGGRKTYRKVNRDWLLSAAQTDPRIFILSNLGKLDDSWQGLMTFLADEPVAFAIPLMGGPPLVLGVLLLSGCVHVTATYNPLRFSRGQIDQVMQAFTPEWLEAKLGDTRG